MPNTNMFGALHGQDGVSKSHIDSIRLVHCPSPLVLSGMMQEAESAQLGLCIQVHFSEQAVGKILFDLKLA